MSPKTKLQIAELSDLTIGELTAKYEKLFGEKCRSRNRRFVQRRVAWKLQADAEGGLSERAILRATVSDFDHLWSLLRPKERIQLLELLVERVEYDRNEGALEISYHPTAIASLIARDEEMLVTNGFFLHRFPSLPEVLIQTNCQLEVSQHGTREEYVKRFHEVKQLVWRWREQHPGIQIQIRQSHRGWMRQYKVFDGKPMPFDSKPNAAYRVCLQKTCTQLGENGFLFKCPALAYFAQLESKLKLHDLPQWQLFRAYQACSPAAGDDEVRQFLQTKSIPQCGLCPSRRTKFVHPNPLGRSALR